MALAASLWAAQELQNKVVPSLSACCRVLQSFWPAQQAKLLSTCHMQIQLLQLLQPQHTKCCITTATAPAHQGNLQTLQVHRCQASMHNPALHSICAPAGAVHARQPVLQEMIAGCAAHHSCHIYRRLGTWTAPLYAQSNPYADSTGVDDTTDAKPTSSRLPASLRLTPTLETKLTRIAERCAQLERLMAGQDIANSSNSGSSRHAEGGQHMAELQREYGALQAVAETWTSLCAVRREMSEVELLIQDPDATMAQEAQQELQRLKVKARGLEEQLLLGMLPRMDGDESRGAIVEVRAGAGGAEASLFAKELFDMYASFATSKGWQCEVLDASESELGGVRTASLAVNGAGAYQQLRWEAGVHRVQRVPVTEASGRLHTSTASVVVLPEADEVEVQLKDSDLEIQAYRASGPGGQHVNTTATAVRVTHLPTGIVVTCQDERSQLRNKERALRVLRARVLAAERAKASHAQDQQRKAQAGTAERHERVRTYNFNQDRMTDHRVGITQQGLAAVMEGRCEEALDEIHTSLHLQEQTQMLEELISEG